MLATDRASLLGIYEALTTFRADAEMAAWHNESVFLLTQAYQAFFILVLVFS